MQDYARARSVDFSEIPVIDIGGAVGGAERPATVEALVHAAEHVGFFYVAGHGIDPMLRQTAFDASARFFDLPAQDKAQIEVDQHQRGWMAQGNSRLEGSKTYDAKEVFFWGWEDEKAQGAMVAPNQWPTTAPWLKTDLMPFYDAVMDLGRALLRALAKGLGADADALMQHYVAPLARGQLVYYPAITETDQAAERFSAAPHSDFGVLTLLAQDDRGGLQVRNRAGSWIEAPPIPDTFVCNIGDLLEMWTGGRLVSTKHRVLNASGLSRYSIPVFCDPASDTLIDPRFFDATGPAITAGDYIAGKNRKNFTHYAP